MKDVRYWNYCKIAEICNIRHKIKYDLLKLWMWSNSKTNENQIERNLEDGIDCMKNSVAGNDVKKNNKGASFFWLDLNKNESHDPPKIHQKRESWSNSFLISTWINLSLVAEICSPAAVFRLVTPGGMFLPLGMSMLMLMLMLMLMMVMVTVVFWLLMIEYEPVSLCQARHVSKESWRGQPCPQAIAKTIYWWKSQKDRCWDIMMTAMIMCCLIDSVYKNIVWWTW